MQEEIETLRRDASASASDAETRLLRQLAGKDEELKTMRRKLDGARATASSNADLAAEAAERLLAAEQIVDAARRAASDAAERVQRAETRARAAKEDAERALADRETATSRRLAEAAAAYDDLAAEAAREEREANARLNELVAELERAEAASRDAILGRDETIARMERSLRELQLESSSALESARLAAAAAETARADAEDAAASAAKDAAATYKRLETSLSHAETELRLMESAMARELANNSVARGKASSASASSSSRAAPAPRRPLPGSTRETRYATPTLLATPEMAALVDAETKLEELERVGAALVECVKDAGLAPVVEFVPPAVGAERASEALTRSGETDPAAVARASEALAREIDSMELLAAHLWAQLEGAGIDPSGAMRRSSR